MKHKTKSDLADYVARVMKEKDLYWNHTKAHGKNRSTKYTNHTKEIVRVRRKWGRRPGLGVAAFLIGLIKNYRTAATENSAWSNVSRVTFPPSASITKMFSHWFVSGR